MKEVGVKWIDPIPNHWEVRKIGQMYKERRTKVSDVDFPPLSVTMKGIVPQLSTAAKTDAHDDRKLVKKGDFAINSRSDRRGSCGIAQQDGSVSLINTVLCPKKETNPEYLNWLFHTSLFADEFYRWGHGIVDDLWTTNWSDMKRIVIPYPSLAEQSRIAAFLDDRCVKIDEAIARHQALIEKLNEYRKSVITKTVTKGVSDNFSCWQYPRLGMYFRFSSGDSLTSVDISPIKTNDYSYPVFGANGERGYYNSFNLDQSRILIGRVGALCGNIHITKGKVWVTEHALIARQLKPLNIRYAAYMMEDLDLGQYSRAACQPVISSEQISRIKIPVPLPEEQQKIVDFLDEKCAAIDSAKERHAQLITKLEEYKKSLIYNAVTGKIEC